jgi:hypothetical protein
MFYMALIMAHLDEGERALAVLNDCMNNGFSSVEVLRRNPWFDDLRSTSGFQELLERSQKQLSEAQAVYCSANGPQVLGVTAAATLH